MAYTEVTDRTRIGVRAVKRLEVDGAILTAYVIRGDSVVSRNFMRFFQGAPNQRLYDKANKWADRQIELFNTNNCA